MSLQLYNTMGRSLQEFIPIEEGKAGFYGCGPTVYNFAHIGNLRAYVFQDILERTLEFLEYEVTHVLNVTDIGHLSNDADDGDDKMVKTAQERGKSVLEIAQFYTDAFFVDLERLNIKPPTVICKATEHISDMIALIKRLEERGHTYIADGNVYYDISTFPDYGKLALLNLDELKAGARIDIDANKRNPYDFVLWFTKSKFENQALVWDSPWGKGYPGWHIECSAMSMKYLGEQFDIHTGGIDHVPIHHTNEIAQSEGATGKQWVRYWLHNEFLILDKGKMSKSSGGFLTLQSLIDAGYDPLDYRFFLLGAHYRSQIMFSWEAMDSARNARKALIQRVAKLYAQTDCERIERVSRENLLPEAQAALADFVNAIESDLSTPRALSALQMAIKDTSISAEQALYIVSLMDSVLGLRLTESAQKFALQAEKNVHTEDGQNSEIDQLIKERNEAKKSKNYAKADEIRSILKERGIILEDTAQGTVWKRA